MTDSRERDPIEVMAAKNPAPIDEVGSHFSKTERDALRERAIERGQLAQADGGSLTLATGRRRAFRFVAVGFAAALILTLVLARGGSSDDPGSPGVEYAAAAVRTAEVNPRILVTAPGWSITHVEPLEPNSGETQFSDGTSELDITWYPARFYEDYREDRADVGAPGVPVDVLGATGTMIRYNSTDFATMLPPQGDVFVEIRGNLDEEAYREILDSLETTDVVTWLAAMPADVVQPDQQAELVRELLQGVPLPPGFDRDQLEGRAVLNADGLRLKVADSVACGWLDSWAQADQSGDEETKAAAVAAMATARDWPAVVEPPKHGGHVKAILDYARQISDDRLDRSFGGVMTTTEEGVTHTYGPSYAVILSCDSMVKRLVATP